MAEKLTPVNQVVFLTTVAAMLLSLSSANY